MIIRCKHYIIYIFIKIIKYVSNDVNFSWLYIENVIKKIVLRRESGKKDYERQLKRNIFSSL